MYSLVKDGAGQGRFSWSHLSERLARDRMRRHTGAAAVEASLARASNGSWNLFSGRVQFPPVETTALRIEVESKPEYSGGILEWKVE
jgi:hypothetical protein